MSTLTGLQETIETLVKISHLTDDKKYEEAERLLIAAGEVNQELAIKIVGTQRLIALGEWRMKRDGSESVVQVSYLVLVPMQAGDAVSRGDVIYQVSSEGFTGKVHLEACALGEPEPGARWGRLKDPHLPQHIDTLPKEGPFIAMTTRGARYFKDHDEFTFGERVAMLYWYVDASLFYNTPIPLKGTKE